MCSHPLLPRFHPGACLLLLAGVLSLGACGAPAEPPTSDPEPRAAPAVPDPVVGFWRPRTYRLAAGTELPVDGRIVFLANQGDGRSGEWSVVFFVTDEDGSAVRGSAEGGAWSRDGRSLLLTHQYHLSAGDEVGPLPSAPLAMAIRSAREADENHREPCEVTVEGDRLTLYFPSGNAMTFERIAAVR